MKLTFDTAEAEAVLDELARRLTDKTQLMEDIGDDMIESTRQNFRSGTSPDGIAWAAKAQSTLEAYAAKGETVSYKPLIKTSTMMSNISFQATPNSVAWGSNAIQSAVMQFGAAAGEFGATIGRDKNGREFMTSTPWGDIPARPFLGVGPDDETAIIAAVEKWLEGADDAS
jgi:phage virion morphogenesis protein